MSSTDRLYEAFYRQFRAEIADRAAGDGRDAPELKENVLTEYIVRDFLEESGVTFGSEICFFERDHPRGRARVNGYAFNDDGDELHLFTTILSDTDPPAEVPKDAVVQAAQEAMNFFDACAKDLYAKLEQASEQFSMAQRINTAAPGVERVRIFILTDGVVQKLRFKKPSTKTVRLDIEVWDIMRLHRSGAAHLQGDIEIDLEALHGGAIPCLPLPSAARDYMAYLAVFPASVLFGIYDDHGPRVLEYNVRSFLQAKGKVNASIRKTLREEPHHFFAFNNGLATTVERIEVVSEDGEHRIRKMRGFQIVNGGQTTASIHRALKEDGADLTEVLVPVKITVVPSELLASMVERISMSANSQNAVTTADFSANHPFHVEIERLASTVWMPGEQGKWFYERARGGYQVARFRDGNTAAKRRRFEEVTPPSRKFTKTDLARYAASWDQLPQQVSRGAQKNFVAFQASLNRLGTRWTPDAPWYRQVIGKAILFRTVERLVRQSGFTAYKANIATHAVAYLAWRAKGRFDFERVWNEQAISPALEKLLKSWLAPIDRSIRDSAAGRNVTEWSKKEDCWFAVRSLDLPLKADPPEFSGTAPTASSDPDKTASAPEDRANVMRCMAVDAETWFRLQAWGRQTKNLPAWDAGVALSLAGLASEGWTHEPTRKQAARGVHVLEVAEQHGLLEAKT